MNVFQESRKHTISILSLRLLTQGFLCWSLMDVVVALIMPLLWRIKNPEELMVTGSIADRHVTSERIRFFAALTRGYREEIKHLKGSAEVSVVHSDCRAMQG
jgi:hypothetical protein